MTLWGGSPSESIWEFTVDRGDRRLLEVDILGSIAHVQMLGQSGILDRAESDALHDGLTQLLDEADRGLFEFDPGDEDVHTAVERRLGDLIGPLAGKLHTGRSRNDQIALDMRLYLLEEARSRQAGLARFITVLTRVANTHASTAIPSYTHLQQAQPTTLGNHLLAHAWIALRSIERFDGVVDRLSLSPLGAGASAGSSLPIDRSLVASLLGMTGVAENTLDSVGTRDLVAEYIFICAQAMTDLSRLAEEVVLWVTSEFSWARLGEDTSTGSSALPQKRNPDVAELVRGRAASVAGDLAAILALQKGLPLAYNRDLQEDKRLVFHADDVLSTSVAAMSELVGTLHFDPPAPVGDTTALDLAEVLVRRGVPFREAHRVVKALVRGLHDEGRDLTKVTDDDLIAADPRFAGGDALITDPLASIAARSADSGAEAVKHQIRLLQAEIEKRGLE